MTDGDVFHFTALFLFVDNLGVCALFYVFGVGCFYLAVGGFIGVVYLEICRYLPLLFIFETGKVPPVGNEGVFGMRTGGKDRRRSAVSKAVGLLVGMAASERKVAPELEWGGPYL